MAYSFRGTAVTEAPDLRGLLHPRDPQRPWRYLTQIREPGESPATQKAGVGFSVPSIATPIA